MEAREHAEHAEHAAHEGDPLVSRVTFTIAVLAVAAAICASLETTEGDKALGDKNVAVLEQNRATDIWNLYEAKSLKKNIYALAADQGGAKAADYAKISAKNASDQTGYAKQAQAFEAARDTRTEQSEIHERRHGRLTIASTLLHMSIAIATLAIILKRQWPWLAALALAAGGVAVTGWAYL